MQRIRLALFPLLALPVMAAAPDGDHIAHEGNGNGAPPCILCHGANLQGNPGLQAPAIAGLPAATVLERLAHYAGPDGHNVMMRQVATALTQPERAAVAAYLAGLPKPQ